MVKKKSSNTGLAAPDFHHAPTAQPAPDDRPPRAFAEIVDASGRPLAVMDLDEVHAQLLPHKGVIVLVYDPQGRLYLKRRAKHKRRFPSRLDCSATGHVRPGEGRLEAAVRLAEEELGLSSVRPSRIARQKAGAENGIEDVSVFCVKGMNRPIRVNARNAEDGFFVSRTELDCLLRDFHELLTPQLVRLSQLGLLFS